MYLIAPPTPSVVCFGSRCRPVPTSLCFSPGGLKKTEQEWTHPMDRAEGWGRPGWSRPWCWPQPRSLSQHLRLGGEAVRGGLSCRQKGLSAGLRDALGWGGVGWEGGSCCTMASPYLIWGTSRLSPKSRLASLSVSLVIYYNL